MGSTGACGSGIAMASCSKRGEMCISGASSLGNSCTGSFCGTGGVGSSGEGDALTPLDTRRESVPRREGIGGLGPAGGGGGGARLLGSAGGSSSTLGDTSASSVTVGELCELLLLRPHLENPLLVLSSVGVSGLENDAYVGVGCTIGESETARCPSAKP